VSEHREKRYTHLILAGAKLLYRLFLRWSVRGSENVPREGAILVVANHVNAADPILLMLAMPRWLTFMAKEELFRTPLLRRILTDAGMFPVARGGNVQQRMDVMRQAEGLLAAGHALAIFPEGSRSYSGNLQEGKGGAAALAFHAGVPILPIAVSGIEQLHGITWLFRRPRVTVTIGAPFRLESPTARLPRSELSRLTDEIMRHIAVLLPEDRRGPYAG
jgi:1-acyl-sn-glycerol-3-phosphate acyltransferase